MKRLLINFTCENQVDSVLRSFSPYVSSLGIEYWTSLILDLLVLFFRPSDPVSCQTQPLAAVFLLTNICEKKIQPWWLGGRAVV